MALSDDIAALPDNPVGGQVGINSNIGTLNRGMKAHDAELLELSESTGSEANIELAYADTTAKVPMNTGSEYVEAAGLSITFATTERPAILKANLGTLYGSDAATWGLAIIRLSDGVVIAEGVANSSPTVGYPPPPVLEFRVPANTASDTYKVATKRWEGGATGEINSQERRAFIQAVSV